MRQQNNNKDYFLLINLIIANKNLYFFKNDIKLIYIPNFFAFYIFFITFKYLNI